MRTGSLPALFRVTACVVVLPAIAWSSTRSRGNLDGDLGSGGGDGGEDNQDSQKAADRRLFQGVLSVNTIVCVYKPAL